MFALPCLQVNTFFLQSPEVGIISHVRVRSSGSGLGPAWHLASVTVTHTGSGQETAFKHGGWLDQQHGLEALLWPVGSPQAAQAALPAEVEYRVEVHTSDIRSARAFELCRSLFDPFMRHARSWLRADSRAHVSPQGRGHRCQRVR